MKVHFYQIYFKEREEQYEENLVEYFLSTIFMANVVAMAGTGDDYNIETRNDNGVEVYSVLENDECNRDEAMAEILRLTGDPSYTQQPSLFRASDPLYQNNQGYHGTTTAYGWKCLYNYDNYFNYVFEGGQSAMWTGSGTCDKIILFENITVTSQTNAIAWPFSITSSVSASSASWNSEAFTGTNIAGASYSNFKISSSGTLRVSFVDGADIYKGNIVYRPMATIYYGI